MSIELAIILFGISLAINIFLGFFAIIYPIRISNRDSNKIKESQKDIEKITGVILKVSEITQRDLKNIENKLIDKVMVMPDLEPKDKKIIGTTISDAFEEASLSPSAFLSPSPSPEPLFPDPQKKLFGKIAGVIKNKSAKDDKE